MVLVVVVVVVGVVLVELNFRVVKMVDGANVLLLLLFAISLGAWIDNMVATAMTVAIVAETVPTATDTVEIWKKRPHFYLLSQKHIDFRKATFLSTLAKRHWFQSVGKPIHECSQLASARVWLIKTSSFT